MLNRLAIPLVLVALGALAPGGRAQDPDPAAAPAAPAAAADASDSAARVSKAIDDYKSVRDDRPKAAQRKKALLWLGEIDHPLATEYLQQELAAVGDSPFAATVIEAIGKVARPSLQPDLTKLLHRASTPTPVRLMAAGVIVRLGDRPLDALLELAGAADETVSPAAREAVIKALVDSGLDRAHRGLAPLLLAGPMPARLKLLRTMESVHGVPPLDSARIQLVHDGDLEVAAVAWRQLAVGKHERAKALTVDVLERVVADPKASVAAELIGGLVRVRDEDFYPALLRFGSVPGEVVKRALRAAAAPAAEDSKLLQFLITQGLEDKQPAARDAAKELLAGAPIEIVRPLVERIRADLRAGKKKALEQAAGLHELLAKDPSWRADLAALAARSDLEGRMLGLAMLLELGADAGIESAQQCLSHKAWELRSLAYRYLTRCRDVTSIPLLIQRHGREEGRLASELEQALFAHTGTRCANRRDWEAWWSKHQLGFVLPHPDTVRAGGTSSGGKTVAYHDIPIVSNKIYFLVDRSLSMAEKLQTGTDKKTTRFDAAKEQLVRVLETLPETHWVNVVAYEANVHPMWPSLQKLDAEHRADVLKLVRAMPMGPGTNIFDSLELAFADPKLDTIYLLTDGEPSAGRVRDVGGIVEEVRRWNRTRQVVIHCIGLGVDSPLLRQLAADSGGSYKCVK